MRPSRWLGFASLVLLPAVLAAQPATTSSSNPLSDVYRNTAARYAKNLVSAFELMPADKYGFKPTPAQLSFGFVAHHLAQANYALCGAFGGMTGPTLPKRDGSEPKDSLVSTLKDSFAFCDQAMATVNDGNLADSVQMFRTTRPRAAAVLGYVVDLVDHYSQLAIYMRLNGELPPTARNRSSGGGR